MLALPPPVIPTAHSAPAARPACHATPDEAFVIALGFNAMPHFSMHVWYILVYPVLPCQVETQPLAMEALDAIATVTPSPKQQVFP